jgi:hypothetical protein
MTSVLQPWVMELPLRAQGTLLTAVRGCDLAPKHPLERDPEDRGCSTGEDSPERQLAAFVRYCVLVPADPRETDHPGAWIQSKPPKFKQSQLGHYPLHYVSHLMHAYEIISYLYPQEDIAIEASRVYKRLVEGLHLNPETLEQMLERLNEDRIAKGMVVS